MENIIASGQNEISPACLKIFNYLDTKSAIRFSQVNRTAWKKFRDDPRFKEIPEFKQIIQTTCSFCQEICSKVLNNGAKKEITTIIQLYKRWLNEGTNISSCFIAYNLAYASNSTIDMLEEIHGVETAKYFINKDPCYYLHMPIVEGRFNNFLALTKIYSNSEKNDLYFRSCWNCHDDNDERNLIQIVSDLDSQFTPTFFQSFVIM